jgi:hypothetical protein
VRARVATAGGQSGEECEAGIVVAVSAMAGRFCRERSQDDAETTAVRAT